MRASSSCASGGIACGGRKALPKRKRRIPSAGHLNSPMGQFILSLSVLQVARQRFSVRKNGIASPSVLTMFLSFTSWLDWMPWSICATNLSSLLKRPPHSWSKTWSVGLSNGSGLGYRSRRASPLEKLSGRKIPSTTNRNPPSSRSGHAALLMRSRTAITLPTMKFIGTVLQGTSSIADKATS